MKNYYSYFAKDFVQRKNPTFIPPSVEIDLSNNCNQACVYCNVEDYMVKFPSKAKFKDFIKLIDNLKSWPLNSNLEGRVNTICFVGGGEPTVFKGYEKIMEYAIKNNFLVSLITNGINLDKLMNIDTSILNKIAWIGVDIDAGSQWLYNKIRKPKTSGNFYKVGQNITNLVNLGVNIDLKVLLIDENSNKEAIDDILKFTQDSKARMVYFRLANVNFKVYSVKNELLEYIKIKAKELKVNVRINESRKIKRNYKKCYALYLLPIFSADGSIYTCCENRGNPFFNLGNWIDNDLEKLWLNKMHHNMFDCLNLKKCPPCRPNIHNIEIQKIIQEPSLQDDLFF